MGGFRRVWAETSNPPQPAGAIRRPNLDRLTLRFSRVAVFHFKRVYDLGISVSEHIQAHKKINSQLINFTIENRKYRADEV